MPYAAMLHPMLHKHMPPCHAVDRCHARQINCPVRPFVCLTTCQPKFGSNHSHASRRSLACASGFPLKSLSALFKLWNMHVNLMAVRVSCHLQVAIPCLPIFFFLCKFIIYLRDPNRQPRLQLYYLKLQFRVCPTATPVFAGGWLRREVH